jgi:hypothetical protein
VRWAVFFRQGLFILGGGWVGAAAALGLGVFLFRRMRRPQEDEFYYFFCPGCKRKLRYRPAQVGHPGMCPRCNMRWHFPAVPK